MTERKKLDHAEALVGEAGPAGLNVDRFRIDLASNAITEAFAADLDEVRAPPWKRGRRAGVRDARAASESPSPPRSSRRERRRPRGLRTAPYEAYRDAALAAGAEPMRTEPPEPAGGDRALRPLRDARARGADRKAAPGARGGAVGARAAIGSSARSASLGRDLCSGQLGAQPLGVRQRISSTSSGGALSGEPESNGGSGSYSMPELDRLGHGVAGHPGGQRQRHVDARPRRPAAVTILPSSTTRSATGSAPSSREPVEVSPVRRRALASRMPAAAEDQRARADRGRPGGPVVTARRPNRGPRRPPVAAGSPAARNQHHVRVGQLAERQVGLHPERAGVGALDPGSLATNRSSTPGCARAPRRGRSRRAPSARRRSGSRSALAQLPADTSPGRSVARPIRFASG